MPARMKARYHCMHCGRTVCEVADVTGDQWQHVNGGIHCQVGKDRTETWAYPDFNKPVEAVA